MKIRNAGYIKLHRKFLKSDVCRLDHASVLLFIKLLLLADKEGVINASSRELLNVAQISCHRDLKNSLDALKKVDAIEVSNNPNLKIRLKNWSTYQASNCVQNALTPCVQNALTTACKLHAPLRAKCTHPNDGHKEVPVQFNIKEYNKNIFKNSKTEKNSFNKTLNILNPVTDLEKLIKYYLQLTNHPGFDKPNANDVLNLAVQQDIPNFEIVLANCKNVTQAAKCVRQFIEDANGTYNLFYLPKQINSVRQKVAAKERREEEERKRREEEYAEYQRILAEDENARNVAD